MLESLYQISEGRLDNPDQKHVNSKVNAGTSAPNCQPSHTIREIEEHRRAQDELAEAERLAGLLSIDDSTHRAYVESQLRDNPHLNGSITRMDSTGSTKSQSSQKSQPEKGSIGSFVLLAKNGYQELVNEIIRCALLLHTCFLTYCCCWILPFPIVLCSHRVMMIHTYNK